jgi:predicted N-acyltransferase
MHPQIEELDITIYTKASDVPNLVWENIASPDNYLMQEKYLTLVEELHSDQLKFYYAVARLDGAIVGFSYFQENIFLGTNLLPYFPSTKTGSFLSRMSAHVVSIFKPLIGSIKAPMLNTGNIFMTGEAGCFCLNRTDKEAKFELQMACIKKICAEYPHIKAILHADFYETDYEPAKIFRQEQFRTIAVEADNIMEIAPEWRAFDDYLNSLTSKYRVRAKKILSQSAEIKAEELSAAQIKVHASKIAFLYNQVTNKVDFKLASLHEHFYEKQKELEPDKYHFVGYLYNNELIGFTSLYELQNSIEAHYFGIDYSYLREFHLYQRMLYDVVDLTIRKRKSQIHFGRTAPEVKTTIGAVVKPMFGYLKYLNPTVNYIMEFFTSRLQPREYILRSPFK